jgi:predicted Zn-dependent protease
LNDQVVEMIRHGEPKETVAQTMLIAAARDSVLGDCGRAIRPVKDALDLSREQTNVVSAAITYAACGEMGRAQLLVDELAKAFPLDTLVNTTWIPIIRAQMELSRGNAPVAVQLLESAHKYESFGEFWPQYLRGQGFLKQNDGPQAEAEFKTILDHRGWYPFSPLYPLAQLGLARAAAMNGDGPAARKAYQDFLALWKDADASLPALVAARAEYEKLK